MTLMFSGLMLIHKDKMRSPSRDHRRRDVDDELLVRVAPEPARAGAPLADDHQRLTPATAPVPHHEWPPRRHAHPPTSTGLDSRKIAIWAFIGSECMLFASLISTYLIYKGRSVVGPFPHEAVRPADVRDAPQARS